MDLLDGVLDGPRARDVFVLRSVLEPPWALRVQDEAALTVVALVRGSAWFRRDGEPPRRLDAHDVAVVRGPAPYVIADHPDTTPEIVIHPGSRCTTLAGEDLHDVMLLGTRSWGNHPEGSTVMLTGTYQEVGEVSRRLLAAIPPDLVVRADRSDRLVIDLLARELVGDQPGHRAVHDRLVDLLLITTLRTWFNSREDEAPHWFRAAGDAVVGPALRLLHDDPSRPWTVASLAAAVGASRAGLAQRFTELVGEPPMTYLTSWRLSLAADLLLEPDATVTSVAPKVGYATPYALSTAFKRHRGVSPSEHRGRRRHGVPLG